MQDALGNWRKTGKIGNQRVRTERGAENMAMSRALRQANVEGYIPRNPIFKG